MANHTVWLVLALALAGAEMLTGTFYLLLYGASAAMGGLMAWLGLPLTAQLLAAAICAIAGTFWLRRHPISRPAPASPSPDIGQRVEVSHWKSGTAARVRHRGADWDAELQQAITGQPGELYIVGQRGNTLIVAPEPPASH